MKIGYMFAWLVLAAPAHAAAKDTPNVIVMIWDTVRADHTTPGGYFRNTTPHLAALARRGVWFKDASSDTDWTLPAVVSLLTSQGPQVHGVFRPQDRLPAGQQTLTDVFREHGYQTASFAGVVFFERSYLLARGFDTSLVFPNPESMMGSLKDSLPAAVNWLAEHYRNPFFLLIHGADAHYPYACPSQYKFKYTNSQYQGPAKGLKVDYSFVRSFNEDDTSLPVWRDITPELWDRALKIKKNGEDLAYLRAQYDGCLNFQDSFLPRLTGTMDRLGLWKNTILIIISDHGEQMGEHGGYGHYVRPLYEEILNIPMFVYMPDLSPSMRGATVDAPASIQDIMPTILSKLGWQPPYAMEGRDLRDTLSGHPETGDANRLSMATMHPLGPKILDLAAFRRGRWKIVRRPGQWELYDLKLDPHETQNLADSRPEVFRDISTRMLQQAAPGIQP